MKRRIASLLALALIAGCASDMPSEAKQEAGGTQEYYDNAPADEDYDYRGGEAVSAVETEEAADAPEAEPMAAAEARPKPQERQMAKREDSSIAPGRPAQKASGQLDMLMSNDKDVFGGEAPAADPSTGEGYTDYGVNQMTDSSEDRLSTFSIDVDTGSYTIARRKLNEGYLPPAASVRVEEFVNYFKYDYPNPDQGAFGVHLEAAPSPFTARKDTYLLRVGVQGKRIERAERKPVHLTFLVDVSGSMSSRDKLPLAQQALKVLTNNLQEGDTVALATYAGRTEIILEPTGVEKKRSIMDAIDQLSSGGGTGMSSGMEAAYKLALENHKRDHVNRVIVVSDGDANIGRSRHEDILAQIKKYVDEGVTLSTVGVGMGNYKDTMMEQLANKGNGNYYYVDSMKEANRIFGEQVDGTLQVIAKDVKIQVEFDPEMVPKYRLIGYENRDIADKDFRNDKVDAGEIGAGHTVTALYEVQLSPKAKNKLATVRIRAKQPNGHKAAEQEFHLRDADVRGKLGEASKDLQFAAAVATFAEIMRNSPYAENLSLDPVEEVAKSAAGNREDRREFLQLVRKAKKLKRS